MSKRVYISADYSASDGDTDVVDELHKWSDDNRRVVSFTDTAQVASGSVSDGDDCRPCDLKAEFNRQINASSAVIFVVGDKTKTRTAGSECDRTSKSQSECTCTPYKQNTNGKKKCKVSFTFTPDEDDDVGNINTYSYLRHEFEQARKRNKTIVIVYNSLNKQSSWLPSYMSDYEDIAVPFWKKDIWGNKTGDYDYIKETLV